MGEVVKMAVNGGDLDHQPALWHLQRLHRAAHELGVMPSNAATLALQLLQGDLRVTHYSSHPQPLLLCLPECESEADFDDQHEVVMFVLEVARRRAKRRSEKRSTVIGFE